MTEPFAKAGERVVTEDGEYICRVKNDLHKGDAASVLDFEDWQGEKPKPGDAFGKGFRGNGFKLYVCIEGKWRPGKDPDNGQ